ncbi:MAG: thioredoxin family protein [Chitinophagaceae bacterium]
MQYLIFLGSFFCLESLNAQVSPKSAEEILKEASQQATSDKKNVFIIFDASWCGWCHKMDSIMNAPACKNLFSHNYIVKHLVILESPGKKQRENPGAMDLLIKFHGDKQGLPYWLIFDNKGNLLADSQLRPTGAAFDMPGENTGCPATPKEITYFINILKKTSLLNSNQLALIEQEFSKK